MSGNKEINELAEIVKKMSVDLESFKKDFKEEFKKINSRLDTIEENLGKIDGEVLTSFQRINSDLEKRDSQKLKRIINRGGFK
jgi:tetrahydromethanopterin S-methyltransferase subunit G